MSSLAERLTDLVAKVEGLSLRELGRIADGVSETYPGLIASGEREKIGTDAAAGLASSLGTTIDYLVYGRGKPPTQEQIEHAVRAARARAAKSPKRTGTSG